jgi:hypothetical protein
MVRDWRRAACVPAQWHYRFFDQIVGFSDIDLGYSAIFMSIPYYSLARLRAVASIGTSLIR